MRSGVIVAGGRSTRFGDDEKAVADLDGRALIRRVADRLAGVVDELVVNCRRDQVETLRAALADGAFDPRFAVDAVPDRGPVAGVLTGLRFAAADDAFVTGCDMPLLDPGFVDVLFERARGRSGAVPVAHGRPQPLCAVYRTEPTIAACETALARDSGRLRDLLTYADPAVLDEPTVWEHAEAGTFRNVNSRTDLAAVAAEL